MKRRGAVKRARGSVLVDDGVRLRALRMLLDLATSAKPRPLSLSGKEVALVEAIRRGDSPSAICNELAISIDDLLSSLWRLSRLPESRADAA